MNAKLSIDKLTESEPTAWQVFWHWQLPLCAWAVTAPLWVSMWLAGEGVLWVWRRAERAVRR